MQGADTGIDAAAERSCAAIGMEYSPGVVVTRRGASFASKVRRGAAVVALAALAAVVCILAIEGHRGGRVRTACCGFAPEGYSRPTGKLH